MLTITVSQLNRYVRAVIEEDPKLRDVYVKGEISGFNRNRTSGHCYFRLTDEGGSVKAVMFRSRAEDIEFTPSDGMAVLVRASVGVYERDGAYQLYVTDVIPDGAGAAAVSLAQRRERLAALGVFDPSRKKTLPAYPARIGVVTSRSGAALQDIRAVLERRWPACTLLLCPATVQGAQAPASLKAALETIDDSGCDVILLARGGGSAEELWSFNDEELVMSVFRCKTPIVSAVGHETDYTLCDFAADARAPTPSAAAELAAPDIQEISGGVLRLSESLERLANMHIARKKEALLRLSEHPALKNPVLSVIRCKEKVDICQKALYNSRRIIMQQLEGRLAAGAALLDCVSPLRVLDRGYCLAMREGRPVISAAELAKGDTLDLRFSDAPVQVTVNRTEGDEKA